MAKYVLIAFEDDQMADDFANAVAIKGGVFYVQPDTHIGNVQGAFVRGLWKKPTKFCECPPGPDRRYARSKKFGWYICVTCNLCHKGWAKGEHFYPSFGVNQLPVTEEAPEWRGSGVANHTFDEGSKNWIHVVTGEVFNGQKVFRERKDYSR
jgi:hypothetical protein